MKTMMQRMCLGLITLFVISACQKDDFTDQLATVGITLNHPTVEGEIEIKSLDITFRESNSGEENSMEVNTEDLKDGYSMKLPYGTYTVVADGKATLTEGGESRELAIKAYQPNVVVNSEDANLALDLFLSDPDAKFVFKEIFFTGTKTPEDKLYNGDKYFILYNNSTEVLYADGLIIAQSSFLTTRKEVYSPDVMDEAFTSNEIIMIPGSGTDYPVNPGEQVVIANNAIDHVEYNANSFSLTGADFEIELIDAIDVDNPDVPNTVNLAGNLTMHNRGFKSYALAKLPEGMTAEQFVEESTYTYSYTAVNGREMSMDAHKIPNEYIMDAVNLSVQENFEWLVTAPSLDMGWTYCGRTDADDNRFGKAVSRKVAADSGDGVVFLQDTNNSTQDFEVEVAPSLK